MADALPFDPTAPKELPKPGPRKQLSKHEYAELFLAQMGKCFRCSVRLAKGNVIDEHMVPRESLDADRCDDLENRKLFCKPCAKEKTVSDAGIVAKTRRVTGGRGSQYEKRRERGGSSIKAPAVSALSKDARGYQKKAWPKRGWK
jgi:hypothetical protein